MNRDTTTIHLFECGHVWRNKNVPKQCPACSLQIQLAEAQGDNAALVEFLKELRSNNGSWRFPKAGGQDRYAGMPGFVRKLDRVLKQPHPGSSLLEELEQLRKGGAS